jgi:hypothetical protein
MASLLCHSFTLRDLAAITGRPVIDVADFRILRASCTARVR